MQTRELFVLAETAIVGQYAMKITLIGDEGIRVEASDGMLTIEAESTEQSYSPYHMLASGLATCTWFVLQSWGENAGISAHDLSIEVRWSFAESPHRVGSLDLRFHWPSLPESRVKAAERAAAQCPVHHTLNHAPQITIGTKS